MAIFYADENVSLSLSVEPEHAGIVILEQLQRPHYAEQAMLIHDLCQQHQVVNALFDWKSRTGWVRNPRP